MDTGGKVQGFQLVMGAHEESFDDEKGLQPSIHLGKQLYFS
jgi:hypothetical protein